MSLVMCIKAPLPLQLSGLGEPLCWLAFGPFATAAALLVWPPFRLRSAHGCPLGHRAHPNSGPALATALVLFCSHFHQVEEDAARQALPGRSPRDGPCCCFDSLVCGRRQLWSGSGAWSLALPQLAFWVSRLGSLMRLLRHHHQPERIQHSKFLASAFRP